MTRPRDYDPKQYAILSLGRWHRWEMRLYYALAVLVAVAAVGLLAFGESLLTWAGMP